MTKLLTIEEAARLLNVSKTSLRRWTNDGRLECVRIGARRERRFRLEDLQRFIGHETAASAPSLDRSAETARTPAPALAVDPIAALDLGALAGVPRHVCLHFETRDEHWRLFRPYLLHHLRRHAPIVYLYDDQSGHADADRRDFEERLAAEGFVAAELERTGLLELLPASRGYLKTGTFSASRMVDFMEGAILHMRAAGHQVGMLCGEMTWCLSGAEGVEAMIPYEMRLNDLLGRYPDITIVCHYDIERLDSAITLGALCSHPHVQLPDRFAPGYYLAEAS